MVDITQNILEEEGLIVRSLSGFYDVLINHQMFVCKPKGVFRHNKVKPLVGDRVRVALDLNDKESEHQIIEVLPRENELVRPPMANVDYGILVMSLIEPDFSYFLLDQYLVTLEYHHIKPIILLTKLDLLIKEKGDKLASQLVSEITNVYEQINYPVYIRHSDFNDPENYISEFQPGIYVVMGQSGVGKSTFLNQILDNVKLETNEISQSLNRGKHTTRQVTLYPYQHLLIADTPGFSSLELPKMDIVDLTRYFPEIYEASQSCKFRSCVHNAEPQCHVKSLVDSNIISSNRYESYLTLLSKLQTQIDNFKY